MASKMRIHKPTYLFFSRLIFFILSVFLFLSYHELSSVDDSISPAFFSHMRLSFYIWFFIFTSFLNNVRIYLSCIQLRVNPKTVFATLVTVRYDVKNKNIFCFFILLCSIMLTACLHLIFVGVVKWKKSYKKKNDSRIYRVMKM